MRKFRPNDVPEQLAHCAPLKARTSLYPWLVWLAHLARTFDSDDQFVPQIRELVVRLEPTTGFSPVTTMGFPDDWVRQSIWRTEPHDPVEAG